MSTAAQSDRQQNKKNKKQTNNKKKKEAAAISVGRLTARRQHACMGGPATQILPISHDDLQRQFDNSIKGG